MESANASWVWPPEISRDCFQAPLTKVIKLGMREGGKTRVCVSVGAAAVQQWSHGVLFSPGYAGGAGCGEGAVPGVRTARGEGADVLGSHAVPPG